MSMGKRIAKARKDLGFTQEYVAATLGVSRQAVFKWEKDQSKPDTKHLIALSSLLNVSVDYLTKGTAENTQNRGSVSAEPFLRASLLALSLLPICWLIGVFSGEYTEMVQIPLGSGDRLGIPFLMYGDSPFAIALVVISILSVVLSVLLLIIGHNLMKQRS